MSAKASRQPSSLHWLFASSCAGLFLYGIVLALLGVLFGLPQMAARLHVNLGEEGDLFLLLYAGIFITCLGAGPLIDWLGHRLVLVFSAAFMALSLVWLAVAGSFGAAAGSVFLLGLGGGGLNTVPNVLVSEQYTTDRGSMLNLLNVFYGAGALLLPFVSAGFGRLLPIQAMLLGAGGLAAVVTLAYFSLRFPPPLVTDHFSPRELSSVAHFAGIWPLALLLFFEAGNEGVLGGWISSYVGGAGSRARAASWILVGYWAALMAGRFVASRALGKMPKAKLILLSGSGAVLSCALLVSTHRLAGLAAAAILAGFSFAAVYPTTLAIAGDRYPQATSAAFGMLLSAGVVGGMLYPWAVGHIGQYASLRWGMVLPLLTAGVICFLATRVRSNAPRKDS